MAKNDNRFLTNQFFKSKVFANGRLIFSSFYEIDIKLYHTTRLNVLLSYETNNSVF